MTAISPTISAAISSNIAAILRERVSVSVLHADDVAQDGSSACLEDEISTAAAPLFDPWQRFAVPRFPLDTLPEAVASFVSAQSAVVGCDPGGLAMSALVALSAAIDHRSTLRMMRHGDWLVSPRLWVLLLGDPSCKKTPIINAATRELESQQNALLDEHERRVTHHRSLGGKPEDDPPPPPRYVAIDTTVEKLAVVLARHDRGILVKRDELSGWVGSMEKYASGRGSSSDRAFWLQAYDGGSYLVDRIARGDLRVKNLSVSLIGGIQPKRLAELHGLASDGLLQRFIPVILAAPAFPQDAPSADREFRLLVRRLLTQEPLKLAMDEAALNEMEALRHHLHDLEQASAGLADGFPAFVGKLTGYAGSLALILGAAESTKVTAEIVQRVARIVREFILPHALEFYRGGDQASPGDRIQRLASWVLTNGKRRLVASDFTSNVADCRALGLWDLNQRVSPLVAGGWLSPEEKGPVSRAWTVNEQVFALFSDRAEEEDRRKARLAELMNSRRSGRVE